MSAILTRLDVAVLIGALGAITELSSDVYGVLTFGPAFLFSFLHFTAGFQRLDASAVTHPPGRLRLRPQFMALDEMYPKAA
jgi:hypothetical protein